MNQIEIMLFKGGKKAFFGSDKLILSEGLNLTPVAGRGIQCASFFLSKLRIWFLSIDLFPNSLA